MKTNTDRRTDRHNNKHRHMDKEVLGIMVITGNNYTDEYNMVTENRLLHIAICKLLKTLAS